MDNDVSNSVPSRVYWFFFQQFWSQNDGLTPRWSLTTRDPSPDIAIAPGDLAHGSTYLRLDPPASDAACCQVASKSHLCMGERTTWAPRICRSSLGGFGSMGKPWMTTVGCFHLRSCTLLVLVAVVTLMVVSVLVILAVKVIVDCPYCCRCHCHNCCSCSLNSAIPPRCRSTITSRNRMGFPMAWEWHRISFN